ncbi:MAG: hypothetical protein JWO30_323 [Fibrobacteres bacterium]|nr:hypothetical protein [Fibrobacterota bacterium]
MKTLEGPPTELEEISLKNKANFLTKQIPPPIFARHETFHPRFGWLKKGFDKIIEDEAIFLSPDAPVLLGVGKNMVQAIRFWCTAFKVVDEHQNKGEKARKGKPSQFGKRLLDDTGWDPYLENTNSLWLLHWHLLKQPCTATAWYFFFNYFHQHDFTVNEFSDGLIDFKKINYPNSKIVDESLHKDVSCLLRMYVSHSELKQPAEESLDCPFTNLNLIQIDETKRFRFNTGEKSNLSPEILVSACLDFASMESDQPGTISITRLLYDIGSPGLAFKISESFICAAIENIVTRNSDITFSETAGLIQLGFKRRPSDLKELILNSFYKKNR